MKQKYLNLISLLLTITCIFSCSNVKVANSTAKADTLRMKNDLLVITKTSASRNYQNIETLDQVAEYIYGELSKTCDSVYYQTFIAEGKTYRNVIGIQGIKYVERIVIGAHYDVAGKQEGADDNASGVAGMLELSRLFTKNKLKQRIDFVAYTLEEPPFFKSREMGSYVHAKSLADKGIKIKGMICLEMIGYYSDKPNSQEFPLGFLSWFYGNKGDFITVVQKLGNGSFGRQFERRMTKQKLIKTKSFKSFAAIPGVDFSDHLNYWKFGYSAVMVTNTAFYRNKNYHEKTDKMETLDLKRMGLVVEEVYNAVNQFH